MYVFVSAPTFISGSDITSAEHSQLASAFNTRLLSGLGDGTRRIHAYILGLYRQVRNPAEDGLNWPALGEALETYAHLDADQAHWPEQDAGEYEGANLANPANSFVFGNPQLSGEGDRLWEAMPYMDPQGSTNHHYWNLAKYQRGGYDPITDNQNCPMFEAAQSHSMIVSHPWNFYLKSAGGYTPQPEIISWCDDGLGSYWPNQSIFYTNLDTGLKTTFPGTCGAANGGTDEDVAWTWEGPFAYYVTQYNGTVNRFDKKDYIEGPYKHGGYLRRKFGDQIQRLMLNPFIKDFRGTDEQRGTNCIDIQNVAFDSQYFLESQYQLAPAYATSQNGVLTMDYQTFTFFGNTPANAVSNAYTIHTDFCLGGLLAVNTNLKSIATVEVYANANELYDTFTIGPDTASVLITYPDCPSGSIYFKTPSGFTVDDSGKLEIEISELYKYKPEVWDAYAYIRLSSTTGTGGDTTLDTTGFNSTDSKLISDNYKAYGCLLNINNAIQGADQQVASVNTNPVYESSRKHIRDWVRLLNRKQLVGYEVINDGGTERSVLYFKRYALGLDNDVQADCFDGIIDTTDSGSNHISDIADTASFSNEWCMDISLKMYGGAYDDPNNSSEWKKEAYGDFFPYINRCHWMNDNISDTRNQDMFVHFQQTPYSNDSSMGINILSYYRGHLVAPESMTAYNYSAGVNPNRYLTAEQKEQFYRSCQIYQPPNYIVSASVQIESGQEIVRVVFSERLQHDHNTSGVVARDITTWDRSAIHLQPYRTDENGIQEYLIAETIGEEATLKIGDSGTYNPSTLSGEPKGSVIPHFFFTRLIPRPFCELPTDEGVESTGSIDTNDTIITCDRFLQMETYLRAMCEGYVDSEYDGDCYDENGYLYNRAMDFTWENLNYRAHGGRWLSMFPTEVRSDDPVSYGPLPNTKIYAQFLFNLSACVNQLIKVRVPLPYIIQSREFIYVGGTSVQSQWPYGGETCSPTGEVQAIAFGVQPAEANTLADLSNNPSEWAECYADCGFTVVNGASWDGTCPSDTYFNISSGRTKVQYKFTPQDPLAIYAMHPNLLALYTGTNNGFFAYVDERLSTTDAQLVLDPDSVDSCAREYQAPNHFWWSVNKEEGYHFAPGPSDYSRTYCMVTANGEVDGDNPSTSDFGMGRHLVGLDPGSLYSLCNTGTAKQKYVTAVNNDEIIVQVPTVG